MFDFLKMKASVDSLAQEINGIRTAVEGKKQRREDLHVLPPPKAELAGGLCAWIDQESERYLEYMQRDVLGFFINNPDHTPCEKGYTNLLCNAHGSKNQVHQPALLLLLGPQIKEAVTGLIEELDYPAECGPPRAERLAEIAKLDKEITKLEETEEKLLSEAAEAGIQIAPLGKHSAIKR